MGISRLALLAFVLSLVGFAAQSATSVASFAPARTLSALTIVSGSVFVRHGNGEFLPALDNEILAAGDVIRTGDDARVVITFVDGSSRIIESSREVPLDRSNESADLLLKNAARTVQVVTNLLGGTSKFDLRLPATTASIRGANGGSTADGSTLGGGAATDERAGSTANPTTTTTGPSTTKPLAPADLPSTTKPFVPADQPSTTNAGPAVQTAVVPSAPVVNSNPVTTAPATSTTSLQVASAPASPGADAKIATMPVVTSSTTKALDASSPTTTASATTAAAVASPAAPAAASSQAMTTTGTVPSAAKVSDAVTATLTVAAVSAPGERATSSPAGAEAAQRDQRDRPAPKPEAKMQRKGR